MALPSGIDTAAKITFDIAAKAKAAGQSFIGRYLVPYTASFPSKTLTAAEAETIQAAGLGILLCYETTANRAKSGAAAGDADGRTAYALAQQLRIPYSACVYFAVDYNAPARDYDAIEQYMRAAAQAIAPYHLGVYGHYGVCEAMYVRGVTSNLWQCCAWSKQISPHAILYQRQGSSGAESKAIAAKIGCAVDMDTCGSLEQARIWIPGQRLAEEDDTSAPPMSDREIYEAVQRYATSRPLPTWAADELGETQEMGITDGTDPMRLIPRYQAAIMAKRAVQAALREAQPMDEKAVSGLLADD